MREHGMFSSISLPDNAAELNLAKAQDQVLCRDSRLLKVEQEYTSYSNNIDNQNVTTDSCSRLPEGSVKRGNNPINMIIKGAKLSQGSVISNQGDDVIPNQGVGKPLIVVDVREFRSPLPSMLYSSGFRILPRTLTVGDYILGIDISYQSFSS